MDELDQIVAAVRSGEVAVVPWLPEVAEAVPELASLIEELDPGDRPAARACLEWLWERGLSVPPESAVRLLVEENGVRGFYALANGQVRLSRAERGAVGDLRYATQPATILTQIFGPGAGNVLLDHSIARARRAAHYSASTTFALDPFDDETSEMWQEDYGFRESLEPGPGRPDDLKRLWLPLLLPDD